MMSGTLTILEGYNLPFSRVSEPYEISYLAEVPEKVVLGFIVFTKN